MAVVLIDGVRYIASDNERRPPCPMCERNPEGIESWLNAHGLTAVPIGGSK